MIIPAKRPRRQTITSWTDTAPKSRPRSCRRPHRCAHCIWETTLVLLTVGTVSVLLRPVVSMDPTYCPVAGAAAPPEPQDWHAGRKRAGGHSAQTLRSVFLLFLCDTFFHGANFLAMVLGLVPSVSELLCSFVPRKLSPSSPPSAHPPGEPRHRF